MRATGGISHAEPGDHGSLIRNHEHGNGGLTNEKAYALGKFARVALGTSQIDYNGRYCMSSAAAASNAAFGLDRGLPFPVTDLAEAEVVLLAGANVAETMPPLMQHLNRAELVVIDPRQTATAESATLHLAPAPGTDLALALGLLHVAVLDGLLDGQFVRQRTEGFELAWQRAAEWWPERTERVTGVPVSAQRRAVRMLGTARRRYVLTGRGAEQHSKGTDTVSAFINLALALGMPGREGSGYGCLTGQGNGQGGREHGQKADQLPGYRDITDPAARAHVAGVWGVDAHALPGPGRSGYELMQALGTPSGPRALLVFGSNPVASSPAASGVVDRLSSLELLVVADFVPSETARMADVVLPVTQWAEEDGTMTNLEGRVLRRRRVLAAPDGVRGDLEVLAGLAGRLGQPPERFPSEPREVFEELRRASAGGPADYSGVSYASIDAGPVHWPCSEASSPRLFLERFDHADGRARFRPVEHREAAEVPDDAYPLYATTGRVLVQYQTGAQTRRVAELNESAPEAFVEVHPETARRAGLDEGQLARVVGRRGASQAWVRHVPSMRTDTVFLLPLSGARAGEPAHQSGARPDQQDAGVQGLRRAAGIRRGRIHHYGRWPRNRWAWSGRCTSYHGDGEEPHMNPSRSKQIVVVGNGPAGHRLAERIRAHGPEHTITILGEEPETAYNRVLLSSVLAGSLPPEATRLAEIGDIDVHTGTRACGIDRRHRLVHTEDGVVHHYDHLVLAPGARSAVPPLPGLTSPDGELVDGAVPLRTLEDCRRIEKVLPERVAVLGGGLVGLEAARGLAGRGVQVDLVHPATHLLDRQLDTASGRLLSTVVGSRGVRLHLCQRAHAYEPGRLHLDGGEKLDADLVVVATGVQPNTELAAQAGIEVNRGIVVDDQLRTNDPNLHALGDCAEHEGQLSGLISPAWEQAEVLANVLTDRASRYRGSKTVTRLKDTDIDLAVLGEARLGEAEAEVVTLADPTRGRYARLALRGETVAGAVLLGFPEAVGGVSQLYDSGAPVPEEPLTLLTGRTEPSGAPSPAQAPDDAVICRCNSVAKKDVVAAWRSGARDFPAIAYATRASTGCGGCSEAVQTLCSWLGGASLGTAQPEKEVT